MAWKFRNLDARFNSPYHTKALSPFPIFLQKLPNFAVMLSPQWYQENCKKGQFIKQTHSCTDVI